MMKRSERDLAAELNNAGRRRSCNQAKLGVTHGVINHRASSRASDQQSAHIIRVLVMVEDVERIHFQGESETLENVEGFSKTHIKVINTGRAQGISPDVAILTQRWLGKARPVETLELLVQACVNVATRHVISMHELAVVDTLNVVRLNGEGEAGLEGGDTTSLPPADRKVFRAVDIASEFFASPKR